SPLISSFIADKYIRAKYILAFSNFFMGIILILLRFQTSFANILFFYLLYSILNGPVIGLTNAIAFHTLSDKRDKFGNIRVWGTAGYMFIGAFFSLVYLSIPGNEGKIGDSLIAAGICAIILSIFALFLPVYQMEKPTSIKEVFPIDAFKILLKKELLIILLIQYLVFIADRFYFLSTAPFLSSIGVPEKVIMPIMSLGQFTEIFALMLLGILLPKIGYKKLLVLGLLAEILRFGSYLAGGFHPLAIFGVVIHGFTYAFVYVTISIYLDANSTIKTRTALHQLFFMLIFGVGGFFGNTFAGKVIDFSSANNLVNYNILWLFPLAIILLVLLLTLFLMRENKEEEVYVS
ncbi:MAG: MFS transporter, partial [Brevinematales bacterium]|nr:MFS transporter [Brevinematales bacterium]